MFGASLNVTISSFLECITFCRSIYVKKVMKLIAFIFEQPSYCSYICMRKGVLHLCPRMDFL